MHLRAGVKNINLQTRRGNCRLGQSLGDPGSQVQIFASALSESLVWSLARTVPGLLASPLGPGSQTFLVITAPCCLIMMKSVFIEGVFLTYEKKEKENTALFPFLIRFIVPGSDPSASP